MGRPPVLLSVGLPIKISDATKSVITYLIVDVDNVDKRVKLRYSRHVVAVNLHPVDVISITEYQIRLRNCKQTQKIKKDFG